MKSCPTCNAKYKGGITCYRCKSDFSLILAVEKDAKNHLSKARTYVKERNYEQALNEINNSLFLLKTEEAAEIRNYILACKGSFKHVISRLST